VLTTEQTTGAGAARHCDIAMMGRSTEEVVTRWEEGRGYSVDVKINGVPMRDARADFDISVEGGDTVLTAVMSFEVPFGPVGRVMERMNLPRMSRLWSGMLAGFKERAETGTDIGALSRSHSRPRDTAVRTTAHSPRKRSPSRLMLAPVGVYARHLGLERGRGG